MINTTDPNFSKHEHCQIVIHRYIRNDIICYRARCIEHNKWSFMITQDEFLNIQQSDASIISPKIYDENTKRWYNSYRTYLNNCKKKN